jgi:hypothetical protein
VPVYNIHVLSFKVRGQGMPGLNVRSHENS